MLNTESVRELLRKISVNIMALSLLLLAASIFLLALSLARFTAELSIVQRDLPKALDRIDRQITVVQHVMGSVESSGASFSEGINKGISSGIVELPLNTVANVGYQISNTAASTGKQGYGFWQRVKDKLLFWQPKKSSATKEASPKK